MESSSGKTKRTFTDEFKREAIRLVEEGSRSEAQVARDLGVDRSLIGKWRRRIREESQPGQGAQRTFPGRGNPRDEELACLQRENARLKEDNEILKKAVGIFTNRPR